MVRTFIEQNSDFASGDPKALRSMVKPPLGKHAKTQIQAPEPVDYVRHTRYAPVPGATQLQNI
jgi:hypothetical protein